MRWFDDRVECFGSSCKDGDPEEWNFGLQEGNQKEQFAKWKKYLNVGWEGTLMVAARPLRSLRSDERCLLR